MIQQQDIDPTRFRHEVDVATDRSGRLNQIRRQHIDRASSAHMGDLRPRSNELTQRFSMVNMRPHGIFSPTAQQLTAARAATGLSIQKLAEATGLGVNTIRRAEAGGAQVLTPVNAQRLVEVLQGLGVTFLEADANGPGVRIRSANG
ncbi:helix-turn-helix domain-containing protein [Brevundimonas abyssalis]|nr:helix-turn-helix transcriptional regulator [Brevundimonas abyssalis]